MPASKPKKKWRIWLTALLGCLGVSYGAAYLYIYIKQVELTFLPIAAVDEKERKTADSIKAKIHFEDVTPPVGGGKEKEKFMATGSLPRRRTLQPFSISMDRMRQSIRI